MKKYSLFILLLLALFLFTWKIGSIPILDGDTASAAKIAKNILETGDWLTMYPIEKGQIVSKPPLFYWIIAIGFKLFGVNEFGLSIIHSLIGVFTVLLTYLIAKELFSEKVALWSGLILLTSAQFFYQARSALYDMPLTFFIAAALYAFVLFEKRRNYFFYYLIPIFTALALLIKGPVGLVLAGIVLFIYTVWNKKFFEYINFHLILAIILFLLVAAPWFVAEYKIIGKPFLEIMTSSNLGRFFHPTDSIGNDPNINTATPQYDFYSYFLQLFILFVPWSVFLYPAIFSNIKQKESRFILSWLFGVILFFSLSLNYKISRYILPAFPALAIIVSKFLVEATNESEPANPPAGRAGKFAVPSVSGSVTVSKWLTVGLIIPLLIIGTFYMIYSFPKQQAAYQPIVLPFIIIFTLGMIISSFFFFKNQLKTVMRGFVFFLVLSYFVLIPCLDKYFIKANPIKDICLTINKQIHKEDRIVLYKASALAHFAGFYLDRDFTQTNDLQEIKNLLMRKGKVYVITEYEKEEILRSIGQKKRIVLFSNK